MTCAAHVEIPLSVVARAVHAHWRAARLNAGWREGSYDRAARTSPYLKDYDDFGDIEARRELWLTLGDLLSVARACAAHHDTLVFDTGKLLTGVSALGNAPDHAEPILAAAAHVHRCWRVINQHFDLGVDDPRANAAFEALSTEDQAITIANLRADMAAIAEVFALYVDAQICHVALDARMTTDRPLMEFFANDALK